LDVGFVLFFTVGLGLAVIPAAYFLGKRDYIVRAICFALQIAGAALLFGLAQYLYSQQQESLLAWGASLLAQFAIVLLVVELLFLAVEKMF